MPIPHRHPLLTLWLLVAAAAAHAAPPTAQAVPCDARDTLTKLAAGSSAGDGLIAALRKSFNTPKDMCSSVQAVLLRLANSQASGGRKLEKDKPFNPSTAAAEYAAATAQADFAGELAALQAGESDPVRRRVIEAVLLHDLGKFEARDLVLNQLVPR